MDYTPRSPCPTSLPHQAQKHVTLNEALKAFDVMTSLSVDSRAVSEQPGALSGGDCYVLPAGASVAAWASFAESGLAAYLDGTWIHLTPPDGYRAWVEDEHSLIVFSSGIWTALKLESFSSLGINAVAELPNRLSIKSDTIPFSHDDATPGTGDMRQAINPAAMANNGSVVFQTDYEAGADVGLIGSADFEIRSSPDGEIFTTGLRVASADGTVSFPAGFASAASVLTSLEVRAALGTIADDAISTADFGRTINGSVIIAIPNSLGSAPVVLYLPDWPVAQPLQYCFQTAPPSRHRRVSSPAPQAKTAR
ncbi:MAG: DUF2793 domain-containing protein [Alphaproteobacteria bacterium]|nr:DUF2793 domain-containing protein [Alphaproteobacteria bacterium]MBU2082827.1 DUF2793 domain-containing protein [Alphaproteobacteria bacterium]MBU2142989.1 DUF2793 domain-containing protein [Alphaproteobacteria bacterium]MBU2196583.1 DUF2793 domain-containing protein [Alphaproteobacteria bacterium]